MNSIKLSHSLSILQLPESASLADVKIAYRTLARRWHPDLNSNPNAAEKFIALDNAYKNAIELLKAIEASTVDRNRQRPKVDREPAPPPKAAKTPPPPLNEHDEQIKTQMLAYIATLTRRGIYRVAIAEIEILQATIGENLEVNRVQAELYKNYGIHLVDCNSFDDARIYFKKALAIDPCVELWGKVDRQYDRIQLKMLELS
ncbi:DnaJ domain-containing protein [Chamaesiphon sp.]|uniref:DnaJ domain-containing protein n=1 Tax=Chamaesiphon sp. TaxID=2814140 RepID=UPI0035939D7B